MELLIGAAVVLSVVGFFFYRDDPVFWKGTVRRVSRIVRASIEERRGKEIQSVSEIRTPELEAATRKEWEEDFSPPKHAIIRTDYYHSETGPWPQWHCKCGESGFVAVSYSLDVAKIRCKAEGVVHVREMNKAEEESQNDSGGDFSF
jgi:hypothetical protein